MRHPVKIKLASLLMVNQTRFALCKCDDIFVTAHSLCTQGASNCMERAILQSKAYSIHFERLLRLRIRRPWQRPPCTRWGQLLHTRSVGLHGESCPAFEHGLLTYPWLHVWGALITDEWRPAVWSIALLISGESASGNNLCFFQYFHTISNRNCVQMIIRQ